MIKIIYINDNCFPSYPKNLHLNASFIITFSFLPRLVGFGLVDAYQKPLKDLPDITEIAYKTSELGHRFHASIDKVILADKMKELKLKKK